MTQKPIEGLDEALSRVQKSYAQFDTFGTIRAVLHSEANEHDLNCVLEAASRYRDMCKPVESPVTPVMAREALDTMDSSYDLGDILSWCETYQDTIHQLLKERAGV